MTNQEKYICIRYPDNRCDRVPRSEADKLVNSGKAVFTSKSRYHRYLNQEAERIIHKRNMDIRGKVKK